MMLKKEIFNEFVMIFMKRYETEKSYSKINIKKSFVNVWYLEIANSFLIRVGIQHQGDPQNSYLSNPSRIQQKKPGPKKHPVPTTTSLRKDLLLGQKNF